MKRIEIRVPDFIHEMLRKESYEKNISMNSIINDVLAQKYLGDNYKLTKKVKK